MLYDRVGRFDLTLLFLQLDVVMWLFTMHHVGATWFMTGLTWGRHLDTRIGTGSLG